VSGISEEGVIYNWSVSGGRIEGRFWQNRAWSR
jgi:hypothetical protein